MVCRPPLNIIYPSDILKGLRLNPGGEIFLRIALLLIFVESIRGVGGTETNRGKHYAR